jgi:hypothetical protein
MVISLKVNRDDDNLRSCLYVNLAGSHMIEPSPKVLFLAIFIGEIRAAQCNRDRCVFSSSSAIR